MVVGDVWKWGAKRDGGGGGGGLVRKRWVMGLLIPFFLRIVLNFVCWFLLEGFFGCLFFSFLFFGWWKREGGTWGEDGNMDFPFFFWLYGGF